MGKEKEKDVQKKPTPIQENPYFRAFAYGENPISSILGAGLWFSGKYIAWPILSCTGKGGSWLARRINERLIQPSKEKMNEELDKPMPRMSRRTFLKISGGIGITGVVGGAYGWVRLGEWLESLDKVEASTSSQSPLTPSPTKSLDNTPTPTATQVPDSPKNNVKAAESTPTPEQQKYQYGAPFAGKEANEILAEMGLNAGSFFHLPEGILDKVSAHLDTELLPIFPPSVMQYKDLIYKLCFDEKGKMLISPNIVAMIITIESGGAANAGSYVGAQGLMQVMPFHFQGEDAKKMKDPETNLKYGIKVFKGFLSVATAKNPQWADTNPLVYIRALMGYNGGDTQAFRPYNELWNETQFYGDHMSRMILTAEVASRLRKKGFSNKQIVEQLRSDEIDARSCVLARKGFKNHNEYERIYNAISMPDFIHPGITKNESAELKRFYEDYQRGYWLVDGTEKTKQVINKVSQPLSPGLSIFYYTGGRSFAGFSENKDTTSWLNINTKRN